MFTQILSDLRFFSIKIKGKIVRKELKTPKKLRLRRAVSRTHIIMIRKHSKIRIFDVFSAPQARKFWGF